MSLVLLDWGTTRLRAHRIDPGGGVLQSRESDDGILSVRDGDFEGRMRERLGDWLGAGIRILASGMITSRQGWVETPYLDCPCSVAGLADGCLRRELDGGETIAFVPGLRMGPPIRDVMRGEEVQILGLGGEGVIVLPGTHSKWALAAEGRVERFASFMTGEFFDVLMSHSILGRPAEGRGHDAPAFRRGVRLGLDAGGQGGILHLAFSARTLLLSGELAPAAVASHLSGLLIGDEIAQARRMFGHDLEEIRIVGSAALAERYADACAEAGIAARNEGDAPTVAGLKVIARALGWIA